MFIAPWWGVIVRTLVDYQKRQDRHPYTCPEHSDVALIPTQKGWHCEAEVGCDYMQDWVYANDINTQFR